MFWFTDKCIASLNFREIVNTGIQPEVSCILYIAGSDVESSEDYNESEESEEEWPVLREPVAITHSEPLGRAASVEESMETLKAKRSLQMQRALRLDELEEGFGKSQKMAKKEEKREKKRRKMTMGGLRYLRNVAIQVNNFHSIVFIAFLAKKYAPK